MVPIETLCALPVRFSNLKHMGRSPAHYVANIEFPKDSAAKSIGRLVHHMALGGEPYAVFEGDRRAGKVWEAFKAEHDDCEIFKRDQVEQAEKIVAALKAHKRAADLFGWTDDPGLGIFEFEINWKIGRRACKGRLDALRRRKLIELKTSTNTEPYKFSRLARQMAYHAQLAWYAEGLRRSPNPIEIESSHVVSVEIEPPYAVTVLDLTARTMAEGEKSWRLWFERLQVCEESDHWPAYVETSTDWDIEDADDLVLTIGGEELSI